MSPILKRLTGFNLFTQEKLTKGKVVTDEIKRISMLWKEQSDQVRKEYKQKALELPQQEKNLNKKSAYNVFISENYSKYKNPENNLDLSQLATKWKSMSFEEKSRYGTVKNSKPGTGNAYARFVQSAYPALKKSGVSFADAGSKMAEMWKALSLSEKAQFISDPEKREAYLKKNEK